MTGDPWPLPGWTWTDAFGWQPPSDSVYTTYGAQMTKEPSEAAMREARELLFGKSLSGSVDVKPDDTYGISLTQLARALDAQKERCAAIVDAYTWTLPENARTLACDDAVGCILDKIAAAIRSAP